MIQRDFSLRDDRNLSQIYLVWDPVLLAVSNLNVKDLSLGSRAADVLRRFEEMKMGINEWMVSGESQLISMDVMNERAKILSKLSQKLGDEAMDSGIDISL